MGIRVRKTRAWELHAQSLLGLLKQLSIKHWSAPKEKMEKDNLSLVLHSKGDLRLVWQTQLSLITNVYVFERLHSVTESWWFNLNLVICRSNIQYQSLELMVRSHTNSQFLLNVKVDTANTWTLFFCPLPLDYSVEVSQCLIMGWWQYRIK